MARSLAELTLSRVCDYLSAMGVELTREVTLQALNLVEAGLASEQENPLQYVMTRIHDHFAIQKPDLPTTAPPVTRGSMSFKP
ncbi:MAG: hypothetical protein KC592_15425 [Nitrospira sp.]|nr:hypothetical protein [Nitrospira sp.]HNP29854.1 hypothetical protein [Nitrospirales bacterium]